MALTTMDTLTRWCQCRLKSFWTYCIVLLLTVLHHTQWNHRQFYPTSRLLTWVCFDFGCYKHVRPSSWSAVSPLAVDGWSIAISMFVCRSVCLLAFLKNIAKFSLQVTCGSVLLMRQCSTLCTFSFVHDVMSSVHIIERMGQNQRWCVCFLEFIRWRHLG